MSHNYPYRRSSEDFHSHQESFTMSDHLHSEKHDGYRTSLQSSPPIYTSPKSTLETYSSQGSKTAENALSLLSSCGLEPEDLSVLAGMPENMITEEKLPHLLNEIRKKKALRGHDRPSSPQRSAFHPHFQPQMDTWEDSTHSSTGEYPLKPPQRSSYRPHPPKSSTYSLDYPQGSSYLPNPPKNSKYSPDYPQSSSYLPKPSQSSSYPPKPPMCSSYPQPRDETQSWQDQWGSPLQTTPARLELSKSAYVVDYNYGQPREEVLQSYEQPAYNMRAGGDTGPAYMQSLSDYRRLNLDKQLAEPYQRKPLTPSSTKVSLTPSTPTKREADDFHGVTPQIFPYACSLCDIAVLSQRDWTQHINGAQHADSQLAVLQMYPEWDCRNGSVGQSDRHSDRGRDVENSGGTQHRAPQHFGAQSSYSKECHHAKDKEGGRVVCAKYAPNSVDETSLRRLVKPFGKAVNFMIFPAQAFIEMSVSNEADHVVDYYSQNPPVVEGNQVTFSLSAMYNFLQNSPVVAFSLLPPGNEKYPELMAIAKRFGPVKHSLFLPNRVLLEMANREDAEKLVQYYAIHQLKMKGKNIQVSHSAKHQSLKAVSGDRNEAGIYSGLSRSPGLRRRSQEKGDGIKKSKVKNSEERARSSRSRSSGRSTSHTRESTSRGPSEEKVADAKKTEIRGEKFSKDTADLESGQQSSCAETKGSVASNIREELKEEDTDQGTQDQARLEGGIDSDMDSDIEGMAVIGEDEEMRSEEDYMEFLTEIERVQTEVEGPEKSVKHSCACPPKVPEPIKEKMSRQAEESSTDKTDQEPATPAPMVDQAGPLDTDAVQEEKQQDSEQRMEIPEVAEEEEPDFPESLEHCITLDELEEEDDVESESNSDQRQRKGNQEITGGNVIYIENLPNSYYTDTEFVNIAREYGKVKRYFLVRRRQEGFIEMESTEDAHRAVRELSKKHLEMDRNVLTVYLSRKYKRLTSGWSPDLDTNDDSGRRKHRRENSRREEQENGSSRTKPGKEEKPPAKKTCVREERSAGEESASSSREEQSAAKEDPSSSREEQSAAKEDPSSSREEQSAAKEDPSSSREEQSAAKEDPSSSREEQSAAKEDPSSSREEQSAAKEDLSSSREEQSAAKEDPSSSREEQSAAKEDPSSSREEQSAAKEDPSSSREEQSAVKEDPSSSREEQSAAKEDPSSSKVDLPQDGEEKEKGRAEAKVDTEIESEDVTIFQPSGSANTQSHSEEQGTSSEHPDVKNEVCDRESKVETKPDPAADPLGPYLPNNPLGIDFVCQKIGYFCSLCNTIYVSEDEAKNEHCGSLSHYYKLKAYLEQNGNPK
ncbi:hypothetical protein AGOR_G00078890 [Albula goreensis]|uniref:RRM domain-containing protein n=1 Tax=Albula goreensis TaxID=1534307 RepID=A0A8T3DNM2_9TELE|nr:hypothetical protein AGOR_G00078890 [Albula goreensis]